MRWEGEGLSPETPEKSLRSQISCQNVPRMEPNPPRIFISYSRTDGRPLAERLESLLRANTLTSWRDKQSMGAGDILPQVLRAIEESEHLALILSPAALASTWVKREWTHARLHGKQVSPILADKSLTRADLPAWIRRQQIFNLEDLAEQNLLLETLKRPALARRVSYMSGHLPEDFVPRPHEYAQLKSAILAASETTIGLTTALRGAGGYGKTSLANYLCRDPDIRAEFTDGILRIDIGRERNDVTGSILELCDFLAPPGTKHPGFQSPDSAADYLASLIGEARILLVIDDVWREAQLRPFLRPGPHVVRLVTTRIREALPRDCTQIQIDEMRTAESFQMLAAHLPGANDPATRGKLTALADRLGHWAQMLRIANAWLRKRTESAEPLPRAIDRFDILLTKKGLTAFDPKDSTQRDKAISACLEPSLEELRDDLARFCELAILPEDEDVPLEIIANLWRQTAVLDPDDSEELFSRFESLSLLQSLDLNARTLSMHDNTLWYLRDRVGSEGRRRIHDAMVKALLDNCNGNWKQLPQCNGYGWHNAINHLRAAGREKEVDLLLTDFGWIKTKLEFFGPQSLFESYLPPPATEGARLVGRAIALSLPTLAADKRELPRQIYGRLGNVSEPFIARLLAESQNDPSFFPAPRWPGLTPPGAETIRFIGHERRLSSVSFSTSGNRIITASRDGTVRIWDPTNGKEIAVIHTADDMLNGAYPSPDGNTIVTISNYNDAKLWDIATGCEIIAFCGHSGPVWDASFSPDGAWIVTASFDGTARVWDADSGREFVRLNAIGSRVNSARFLADGLRIVTASRNFSAQIWDVATGLEIFSLNGHKSVVNSACPDQNGGKIVTASRDGSIRLFDASNGSEIRTFGNSEFPANRASFSPDGLRILACLNKTAILWDTESGQEIAVLRGHESVITDACFSLDGTRIATASIDKSARLWVVANLSQANKRPGHESEINCANFSPDGALIITASGDSTARLWDPGSGQEVGVLLGHEGSVHSARFSMDGTRALTASSDCTARLWDIAGRCELTLPHRHTNSVTNAHFSQDSVILTVSRQAILCWDMNARLFDMAPGQHFAIIGRDQGPVTASCYSSSSNRVATAHSDGTVRLWDMTSRLEALTVNAHENSILCIGFSPDGSRVITGSADKTARVWDTISGREILVLRGHEAAVTGAHFATNGRVIATKSEDKTVRLWNFRTGLEIARIAIEAGVTALSLHGHRITVGDALGRLHVYDADRFFASGAPADA